ncbi:hypothetical protein DDV23_04150 [Streptococcus chenjunshii]|uniref:Uncharacterized protein n=1 Tax=Streptococcus chenjunshii TaxID=2173853 RepID=A0A372KMP0_9STRE|nr:hypothetical protein DDV23_04150 [Streptococcus chenjunshii]
MLNFKNVFHLYPFLFYRKLVIICYSLKIKTAGRKQDKPPNRRNRTSTSGQDLAENAAVHPFLKDLTVLIFTEFKCYYVIKQLLL